MTQLCQYTEVYHIVQYKLMKLYMICNVISGSVWVLSCVWLFVTPWTVAHQAPPSMEFSRQEYSGVGWHFLLQGIFLTQSLNSPSYVIPALQVDSLPLEP